jgi:polyphosphate kinase 2
MGKKGKAHRRADAKSKAGANHNAGADHKPGSGKKSRGRRQPRYGPLSDHYYPSSQLDDLNELVVESLAAAAAQQKSSPSDKFDRKLYEKELIRLQEELVKMQYWVKSSGFRLIVLFEGRDAAGKGGTIKRITEPLNPRGCRVVALGTPSDQQKSQWYFQRYVEHFPSASEIVIFDRSWYNRAGVERVMGFCTPHQVEEFLHSCPEFERMLVRSGIVLLKYWFSVSDEEQEARFQARIDDPTRRWKLSPMDLEARDRWVEFSQAKDEMFSHTNIPEAPWFTVEADDKRRARLNTIHHLLSKVPYTDVTPPRIKLPPRKEAPAIYRPPINEQFFVPNCYP